ncbi:MAG TPA: glycosyltransferase [Bacteroidales bacterium]|jgi:glycosyltransferase involved in cell wall biosynthesis|nr:glycosyltransferase [Bacteroidales bacterium]
MTTENRILVIDFTNYEDYPIGGYLSFAKNLMEAFGNQLALVGITSSDPDPTGRWFKKNINGTVYDFFALARYRKKKTRNLIPDRLMNYILLRHYKKSILGIGINNIYIQRHETLVAIANNHKNICYCFAELENPLDASKYNYANTIANLFEKIFFRKILFADTILANGDSDAINNMLARSKGILANRNIVKFPTRINTKLFRPVNKSEAREKLELPAEKVIVLTAGRIALVKGWKLMIDAFIRFNEKIDNSMFIFIGEGEDFDKVHSYITEKGFSDKIILKGKKSREEVALFLNASDLFIMGSFSEGWPTALMEAIACGIPAIVTEFSSVNEIIFEGLNGYINKSRNADTFALNMIKALELQRPVKNDHITVFSTENLKSDLLKYWKLS